MTIFLAGPTRRAALTTLFMVMSGARGAAQSYPERPIRLVVPFPPGGGVDTVARLLAEPLAAALGQAVIIDNRAGAGGAIGVDFVAKSPPDGYTLAMTSPGNMTVGPVVRRTPYDPLALGFVARLVSSPLLLVCRPSLEARNLAEFVELLQRRSETIRFASGGVGTGTHLAGELLNLRLGARMVHVPYRGTAPALTDLIAGTVDVFFSDASALSLVEQGSLRLLAVSTAARWHRSPQTPPIATVVPDFDIANWYGVIAPPATPTLLRERLAQAFITILNRPEVMERLDALGFAPAPLGPDAFAAFLHREIETWRAVVQAANIRVE